METSSSLTQPQGPVIRISPHELHISDPPYFNTLYRQDAHYDKYAWSYDAFGLKGTTFTTASHLAHRARRQPLAPFLSQAKVLRQQDSIWRHLAKLRSRLDGLAKTGTTFNLGAALTALARDVSNDYILGKSYNSLDCEDFDVMQLVVGQGVGAIWRISKFVRFIAPTIQALPITWLIKVGDSDSKAFFRHLLVRLLPHLC